MPTLAERLQHAAQCLALVTETPRLDAEILLAHALGVPRARLLARLGEHCAAPGFKESIERRLAYEPIAYILGEWEFYSLTFEVEPPLLVPRPETEHVVEAVLDSVADRPARVLDIGTGTGCIAVAIAHNAPRTQVCATDISVHALEVARRNAQRHGVAQRMDFRLGDLFDALDAAETLFDAICSNPPYVEERAWHELPPVIRLHEDPRALMAGPDGLDVVYRLVEQAKAHLCPGALLAFEIGMGQDSAVHDVLRDAGYHDLCFVRDLAGINRVAVAHTAPG